MMVCESAARDEEGLLRCARNDDVSGQNVEEASPRHCEEGTDEAISKLGRDAVLPLGLAMTTREVRGRYEHEKALLVIARSVIRDEAISQLKAGFGAWRQDACGSPVHVFPMLHAKNGDLAAAVVDGVEDAVIPLSDSVGFGLGVELFGLSGIRIDAQTQNGLIDAVDVLRGNSAEVFGD